MTTPVKKYDYRCPSCGRLAFRAYLAPNTQVAHRCAKCGRMLVFNSNGKKVTLEITEKETSGG